MPEGEARWIADPTHRHQLRWWNGTRWTEHVSDDGVGGVDWGPKGPPAPRRAPSAPSRAPLDEDVELRGLLEESPQRQRERERRRTFGLIAGMLVLVAAAAAVVVAVSSGGSGGNGRSSSTTAPGASSAPSEGEATAARQAVLDTWGACVAAAGIDAADIQAADVAPTNGSVTGRPVDDEGRVMLVTLPTGEAFIVHLSGPTSGAAVAGNAAAESTLGAARAAGGDCGEPSSTRR